MEKMPLKYLLARQFDFNQVAIGHNESKLFILAFKQIAIYETRKCKGHKYRAGNCVKLPCLGRNLSQVVFKDHPQSTHNHIQNDKLSQPDTQRLRFCKINQAEPPP